MFAQDTAWQEAQLQLAASVLEDQDDELLVHTYRQMKEAHDQFNYEDMQEFLDFLL